ncbi:MAG: universal stress protein [Nitrospirae bacterium]|nr:universal stress protein [Nitrospirota bacterium]
MFKKILLATHGSDGAQKAEDAALKLAKENKAKLSVLYITHASWATMSGIDWLNRSNTRMRFARHMEDELENDAKTIIENFQKKAKKAGVKAEVIKVVAEPYDAILEQSKKSKPDIVVIGAPQKYSKVYKYRIPYKKFLQEISCPVFIAK